MKRIMLVCLTAFAVSGTYPLYAQSSGSDFMAGDKSLFEEVTGIKKKTDKFNLYLNMHGDFNMKWNDSGFDRGAFEMKQLRIEMKGDINDWLSYRYRQRLNRGNDGSGNIDNVPTSIDWAGVGIKLNKFSFFAGKQCASYGGIAMYLYTVGFQRHGNGLSLISLHGLSVVLKGHQPSLWEFINNWMFRHSHENSLLNFSRSDHSPMTSQSIFSILQIVFKSSM